MKTFRKTILTLSVTVFSVVFALLVTVLVSAACSERVTLRFETGDGTYLASVEGSSGSTYEKPSDPEKEGYYFDGWYQDAGCEGERLSLPDVLPGESTTYFAKYLKCPVLTLDADGGELAETSRYVRPGTLLSEYLADRVPQKEGLVFGGWELGGEILGSGAVMPENDLNLVAKYKAEYMVCVYLQSADDPEKYERSAEYSYTGAQWADTEFLAEIPSLEHFSFEAEKSAASGELRAGGNLFELRFCREELEVSYSLEVPGGEKREESFVSRYGAHIGLGSPECPLGYEFFGWRSGGKEYAGGETVTLEEPLDLVGVWGKLYPALRGEGTLAVEVGEAEERRAVFENGEERAVGVFYRSDGSFAAGAHKGRLERDGFLTDDSGKYIGKSLFYGTAGEEYGVLTLDFGTGKASYRLPQAEIGGEYRYEYDEEAARYTGNYLFEGSGATFYFRLDGEKFLREGEEKERYTAYSYAGKTFLSDTLTLDGYGGAVFARSGVVSRGSYRGGRYENEWLFIPEEGESVRVLLGSLLWSDDEAFIEERSYLYYDPLLDGEYAAEGGGTLTLDGYGVRGVYRAGGTSREGAFLRTGDLITLYGGEPLRFTLKGENFVPTGEEYGEYAGEKGTLFLDGAGGALLGGAAGSYRAGDGAWEFEGSETFSFRLSGQEYRVFDGLRYGNFENPLYGLALVLDGYGSGTYYPRFAVEIEAEVLYSGEELFVLRSDMIKGNTKTLALSVNREEKTVSEIAAAEAGIFPVFRGQEFTGGSLVLDGKGGAALLGAGEKRGEYRYEQKTREVSCMFGDLPARYRFEERGGVTVCVQSDVVGVFRNGGETLTLDGYGGAIYSGDEGFSAKYAVVNGRAEILRERELLQFELSEGEFSLRRFTRYLDPLSGDELYLQTDDLLAIYAGEVRREGIHEEFRFLSEGMRFEYRLKGENFYYYEAAQEGHFRTPDGAEIDTDGCGFGVLTAGGERTEGSARITSGGLVVFSSPSVKTPSGQLGFRIAGEGLAEALGEEFGTYERFGGEGKLFLRGDGTLFLFEGGVWRQGEYAGEEELLCTFAGGDVRKMRVRRGGEGGVYEECNGALAALTGEYPSAEGTLALDGYGVRLGARAFVPVCAGEDGAVLREADTGEYFILRLGTIATLRAAHCNYRAAP